MACKCTNANQHHNFPVFGPQPLGAVERWPEYFIPDQSDPGYGHYYCPYCRDGLAEARNAAGLPKLIDERELSWLEKTLGFMQILMDCVFGIRPQSTAGESR